MAENDVPKKFDLKKMRVTPTSEEAPAKFDLSKVKVEQTNISPFPATKESKEGVYQMQSPEGDLISVPYSKVMSASSAGYKISPDDRLKYGKDKLYELSQKGQRGKFNPNTDLPDTFDVMSGAHKGITKEQVERKALELLPTAGGIAGGIIGGGVGLETGPGAIVTGALGASAGGGLGEDIRQAAEERIFPFDRRKTAKESATEIGKQAAIQGASEATGRAAGKVFSPALKYYGQTAVEGEKAGVRLLPSEAAGKAPSYVEKFMKGSVLTSRKMDRFRAIQNEQTKAAVNKIANQLSSFKGTPEELGKLIQGGIDQHTREFRLIQNQMYDDIGKQVNEQTINVPITTTKQVATGVLDRFGNPVYKTVTSTRLEKKIVDDVMPSTVPLKKFAAEELKKLDQVEKVLDPNLLSQSRSMLQTLISAPDNMTYNAMRAARSDTLAKVRELDQALAGKQAGLAKKMAELFDTSIMDAVKKSKIPGLEAQVRAADAFTANEHKMFEQALVKKVVDTKKPEAIATLIRGKSVGNEELRNLFTILPKELHQPVQRQIIVDAMRQSTNTISKAFNERRFAETIGSLGDDRGRIIFGTNWDNVKELTRIMGNINGPVGLQGGAGAALQNFAILKNAMLLAIPGGEAARGQWLGALGSLAGEWALLNALASAMTHPETAVKMLQAARAIASKLPYAVTGAVAVTGGPEKNLERVKEKAREVKEKMEPAPAPAPTTPPAATPAPSVSPEVPAAPETLYDEEGNPVVGPESSAKPTWTHVWDEARQEIVPV